MRVRREWLSRHCRTYFTVTRGLFHSHTCASTKWHFSLLYICTIMKTIAIFLSASTMLMCCISIDDLARFLAYLRICDLWCFVFFCLMAHDTDGVLVGGKTLLLTTSRGQSLVALKRTSAANTRLDLTLTEFMHLFNIKPIKISASSENGSDVFNLVIIGYFWFKWQKCCQQLNSLQYIGL